MLFRILSLFAWTIIGKYSNSFFMDIEIADNGKSQIISKECLCMYRLSRDFDYIPIFIVSIENL